MKKMIYIIVALLMASFVIATNYQPNEPAKLWVQFLNDDKTEYIDDGVCLIHIYSPLNEVYIEKSSMSYFEDGVYYFDFNTPQQQGTYPVIVECYNDTSQTFNYAKSEEIFTGILDAESYLVTYEIDGQEHKIKEIDVGGTDRIAFQYNISINESQCLEISQDLFNGISIVANFKWQSIANDNLVIHVYNFSNQSWIALTNKIIAPNDRQTVTNTIETNNLSLSGLVENLTLLLYINDSDVADTTDTKLEVDYISVSCDQYSNPVWTDVKGGSEIHITNDIKYSTEVNYGELLNNTFFDRFRLYYTVSSFTTETENVSVDLDLFNAFPCKKVFNVSVLNESTGKYYKVNYNCELNVYTDVIANFPLEPNENYIVKIDLNNYWKQEVLTDYANSDLIDETIAGLCSGYRVYNNLTAYEIPPISGSPHPTDKFYTACYGTLNTFYELEMTILFNFIPLITGKFNFTEQQMEELESTYFFTKDLVDKYNLQSSNIVNALSMMSGYSNAAINNPTNPAYSNFWANISTVYENYKRSYLIPNETWTVPDINLTTFEFKAINETIISQYVWNNTERNLTTFQFDIINNTAIAQEVWAYTARNLTYTDISYTTIQDFVWNYTARYTHGILI